jgi:hypothetical protein
VLFQDEKGVLAQNHDVVLHCVLVVVHLDLTSLLTDVADPRWLHDCFLLIFGLCIFLGFDVIIRKSLHGQVVVTLNLQFAVGDNDVP